MTDTDALADVVADIVKTYVAAEVQRMADVIRDEMKATLAEASGPKGDKGDKGDTGEGIPGRDGRDGQPGRDGTNGKDGRDGTDGKDGADGFGFEDMAVRMLDDGRTLEFMFVRGDMVKTFPVVLAHPIDRGTFKAGTPYRRGDGVTFGGSWFVAQTDDPEGAPEQSKAWRLAVKRGRDGKDADERATPPASIVKLR